MDHSFTSGYRRFGDIQYRDIALRHGRPGSEWPFLAGLLEGSHTIVLRETLARLDAAGEWPPADLGRPAPQAQKEAEAQFAKLREEVGLRFREYRDKWRTRLGFALLHPFLVRNQWLQAGPDGFGLPGRGGRKEAKMFYLQTLHDAASDCERQVAALQGLVYRAQGKIASAWHGESAGGAGGRWLALLEEGLREGEFQTFKRLRLDIGALAQERFVAGLARWDKRRHPTEEKWFRNLAWPWYDPARHESGFHGFMEGLAALGEGLSAQMLRHYGRKWELFLGGLGPHPEPGAEGDGDGRPAEAMAATGGNDA